jgi:hypothetical protein
MQCEFKPFCLLNREVSGRNAIVNVDSMVDLVSLRTQHSGEGVRESNTNTIYRLDKNRIWTHMIATSLGTVDNLD